MDIIGLIVWPAVLLLVVIFFALLFRKEIALKIAQFQSAQVGKNTLAFMDTPAKIDLMEQRQLGAVIGPVAGRVDRVGNIFWLSHDLHFTMVAVLTEQSSEDIQRGFRQIRHHLTRLEMGNPEFLQFIEEMEAKLAEGKSLTEAQKLEIARDIERTLYKLGATIETHQDDFVAFPQNV